MIEGIGAKTIALRYDTDRKGAAAWDTEIIEIQEDWTNGDFKLL
jgi:hypothetical protein